MLVEASFIFREFVGLSGEKRGENMGLCCVEDSFDRVATTRCVGCGVCIERRPGDATNLKE
jgi:ferredoxin